jgi:hypothetical protein
MARLKSDVLSASFDPSQKGIDISQAVGCSDSGLNETNSIMLNPDYSRVS